MVQSGGSATLIAGQKINYLPTTTVNSGGYMHGYISTDGQYCGVRAPAVPAVVSGTDEQPVAAATTSFKIYPNPTSGNFTIELTGEVPAEKVTVDVFGMWGERALSTKLTGERKHEFSLSDRPSGVYFIRVITGDKSETLKIIKQ